MLPITLTVTTAIKIIQENSKTYDSIYLRTQKEMLRESLPTTSLRLLDIA